MRKALIFADSAKQGEAAARRLVFQARTEEFRAIHLLTVQPPLTGYASRFLSRRVIRNFHREEGIKALAPARAVLDEAGLPYTVHVEVGNAAEVITQVADELGVTEIMIGADELGALDHLMLRVLVGRIVRLADVPVVLVKSPRRTASPGALRPAFSR
jgi:nucleotide-binding universal stress UspA family protein